MFLRHKELQYCYIFQHFLSVCSRSFRSFVCELAGRAEKACAGKVSYKPDSVTPVQSGGMGQIPSNSCKKLVAGYPKRFPQVKQFKGNATKY